MHKPGTHTMFSMFLIGDWGRAVRVWSEREQYVRSEREKYVWVGETSMCGLREGSM